MAFVLGLLVLIAAGFFGGSLYGGSRSEDAAMQEENCPRPAASEPQDHSPKATVTKRSGAATEFRFGRGVPSGPRPIPLDLTVALPVDSALPVQPGLFVRDDGVPVPRDAVQAWGVVTGERIAEVTICVDARALTSDPDRYDGAHA